MTEILIYGIVGDSWDGLDAKTLVPMISAGDDDLIVRINSPGGFVMEGLAIYNALARVKQNGRGLTVNIDGLAASMASVLAMAGDAIIMADNALMMIHNPWDCACGDANELRRAADKLDLLRDQLVGIYGGQTGLSSEELVPLLDAETWLTAEQALDRKFITSISAATTAAASNVSAFGFRKAPDSPLITALAMARPTRTAAAVAPKEKQMPQGTTAAAEPAVITAADVQTASEAAATAAVAAERTRAASIRALALKHGLPVEFANELVDTDVTLDSARAKILDRLAEESQLQQIGHNGPLVRVTADERDKFMQGAANWIMVRAGVAGTVAAAAKQRGETLRLDPGEFRGVSMVDLARESLQMAGVNVTTRNPRDIVGQALTARSAITQGTGDFAVLLENTLHKTLQAAYVTTPDTWTRFCGIGTVTDFRAHSRYLRGTFGVLDAVDENGEFKQKPIPDGAKEKITATTKGNIIALSRQALINDDLGAFSDFATDLGRAAKLTIEVDVYAFINSNPNTQDGQPFFSAAHGNLRASGAPPSVAEVDAMRQLMMSQKDLSGNEYLEISPAVALLPLALGGPARVVNGSQYDPDTAGKLQRTNIAYGIFKDIVDTPRLSGAPWYTFADRDVAPAIEVAFLDGVQEPFLDSEQGWRVDGTEWKVRLDYGVGGVNYRSAAKTVGQ